MQALLLPAWEHIRSPSLITPSRPPINHCTSLDIVYAQNFSTLLEHHMPDMIPKLYRPDWSIPIPELQPSITRTSDVPTNDAHLPGR